MKKLAIIGASYLQDPLIQKAKSMGLETHVFAWAAQDVGEKSADYFYPISIVEKEKILEKCREIGIDGICSIASDLAVITVNYVAEELSLNGNSVRCSELSTNKHLMREAFENHGDPSPKYVCVHSGKEAEQLELNYPVIVKPTDRSGSRGVTRVNNKTELMQAIESAKKEGFSKEIIIEEYVKGKEYSVECISFEGKHTLLSITQKYTTGEPNYIETGHMEPAELTEEVIERVRNVVYHALDSLEIKYGASHSELKIDGDKLSLIEIGSRMGGDMIGSSLVPLSTGVDFLRAVIQIAMGEEPELQPQQKEYCAGIRYIFTRDDIDEYYRMMEIDPEIIVEADIPKSIVGKVLDSSSRKGFYIFSAEEKEIVKRYMPR